MPFLAYLLNLPNLFVFCPDLSVKPRDLDFVMPPYESSRHFALRCIREGRIEVDSPEMVDAVYAAGVTQEDLRTV